MPKRSADRPWVNRADPVERAWPRDHLPSGSARRPQPDAPPVPPNDEAEPVVHEGEPADKAGATRPAKAGRSRPGPA